MTADPFIPGAIVAETAGTTVATARRTTDADSRATWWVSRTLSHVLGVAGAILLAACQAAGPGGSGIRKAAGLPTAVTPAAWAYANRLIDRFEADRARSGMVGVISDIEACYAGATWPQVDRLGLRRCMVFDTFAVRLDAAVAQNMPGVGGELPYLQTHAAVLRANRYGPLAGFNDPEIMRRYLIQGSNTMFAALAARRRT